MTKKMGCGQYVGCLSKAIATFIGIVAALSIAIYVFISNIGGVKSISKALDDTSSVDSSKWGGYALISLGVFISVLVLEILIIVAIKSKKARSKEIVFYALVLAAIIASVALGYISVTSAAAKNSYAELLIANTAVRYFVLFGVLLLFLREKFFKRTIEPKIGSVKPIPVVNVIDEEKLREIILKALREDPNFCLTLAGFIEDSVHAEGMLSKQQENGENEYLQKLREIDGLDQDAKQKFEEAQQKVKELQGLWGGTDWEED